MPDNSTELAESLASQALFAATACVAKELAISLNEKDPLIVRRLPSEYDHYASMYDVASTALYRMGWKELVPPLWP